METIQKPYEDLQPAGNVFSLFSKDGTHMKPVTRRRWVRGASRHNNKYGSGIVVIGDEVNDYGDQRCIHISDRYEAIGGINKRIVSFSSHTLVLPDEEYGICNVFERVMSSSEVDALEREATEQEAARRAHKQEAEDATRAAVAKGRELNKLHNYIPAGTKAVILAEYEEDDSDPMTDYFATKTTDTHILATSAHTRDLFPELRKAAARWETTRHLAEVDKNGEHREKYSMGAGYYLAGSKFVYASGWRIVKRSHGIFNDDGELNSTLAELLGRGKHSLGALQGEAPKPVNVEAGAVRIALVSEKNRIDVFFPEKPDAETLGRLKCRGFRYRFTDRAWYHQDNAINRMWLNEHFGAALEIAA